MDFTETTKRCRARQYAALALAFTLPCTLAFSPSPLIRPAGSGIWNRGGRLVVSNSEEDDVKETSVERSRFDVEPTPDMDVADLDPYEYFADRNDFDVDAEDKNTWVSADDTYRKYENGEDWEEELRRRNDGSIWSAFDGVDGADGDDVASEGAVAKEEKAVAGDDVDTEAWLDTLASISAKEIEFNLKESNRADQARQMHEWGFDSDSISSTLGVATDESLEKVEDNELFETFKTVTAESGFGLYIGDDIDMTEVESHTMVEKNEETGDPIRSQHVYVDEHACIGCTNCAMIAQSTFFMHDEHGRARVFQQWGDDDETIQVAIETCPVDCIHYIPYDELVRLEVDRRDQNINAKARLVSQGEYGGGQQHKVGGSNGFTAPQQISGNMGSRCNNCPSRGCKQCPMFGIGENPDFKMKEAQRKANKAEKLLKQKMQSENRSVEL